MRPAFGIFWKLCLVKGNRESRKRKNKGKEKRVMGSRKLRGMIGIFRLSLVTDSCSIYYGSIQLRIRK